MGRTENPNLKNDYERAFGWNGNFNKSEMALFSECTHTYAQKTLDTADIVRDAMLRQQSQVRRVYYGAVFKAKMEILAFKLQTQKLSTG